MAKSNLREKQKTFNFGLFVDDLDSEEGKLSDEIQNDYDNQNEIDK